MCKLHKKGVSLLTHNEHIAQLSDVTWESTSPVTLVANYITTLYENGHITAMTYDGLLDRIRTGPAL